MKFLVIIEKKNPITPLVPNDIERLIAHKDTVGIYNVSSDCVFSNEQFIKAGAKIEKTLNENIIKSYDVIVSYSILSDKIYSYINPNQIAWCHGFLVNEPHTLQVMLKNSNNVISTEAIHENGMYPFNMAYDQLKGYYGCVLCLEALARSKNNPKANGYAIGKIANIKTNTTFVILNYSYAGFYAAKTALALGANVIYLDNDKDNLHEIETNEELKTLSKILKGKLSTEIASYDNLIKFSKIANVLIATNPLPTKKSLTRINLEMINSMPRGGVYMDLGCESGFSANVTSAPNINNKHSDITSNVKQIVIDKIPSLFPNTLSQIFSELNTNYFLKFPKTEGFVTSLKKDPIISNAFICSNGNLTNQDIAKSWNLIYSKLDQSK